MQSNSTANSNSPCREGRWIDTFSSLIPTEDETSRGHQQQHGIPLEIEPKEFDVPLTSDPRERHEIGEGPMPPPVLPMYSTSSWRATANEGSASDLRGLKETALVENRDDTNVTPLPIRAGAPSPFSASTQIRNQKGEGGTTPYVIVNNNNGNNSKTHTTIEREEDTSTLVGLDRRATGSGSRMDGGGDQRTQKGKANRRFGPTHEREGESCNSSSSSAHYYCAAFHIEEAADGSEGGTAEEEELEEGLGLLSSASAVLLVDNRRLSSRANDGLQRSTVEPSTLFKQRESEEGVLVNRSLDDEESRAFEVVSTGTHEEKRQQGGGNAALVVINNNERGGIGSGVVNESRFQSAEEPSSRRTTTPQGVTLHGHTGRHDVNEETNNGVGSTPYKQRNTFGETVYDLPRVDKVPSAIAVPTLAGGRHHRNRHEDQHVNNKKDPPTNIPNQHFPFPHATNQNKALAAAAAYQRGQGTAVGGGGGAVGGRGGDEFEATVRPRLNFAVWPFALMGFAYQSREMEHRFMHFYYSDSRSTMFLVVVFVWMIVWLVAIFYMPPHGLIVALSIIGTGLVCCAVELWLNYNYRPCRRRRRQRREERAVEVGGSSELTTGGECARLTPLSTEANSGGFYGDLAAARVVSRDASSAATPFSSFPNEFPDDSGLVRSRSQRKQLNTKRGSGLAFWRMKSSASVAQMPPSNRVSTNTCAYMCGADTVSVLGGHGRFTGRIANGGQSVAVAEGSILMAVVGGLPSTTISALPPTALSVHENRTFMRRGSTAPPSSSRIVRRGSRLASSIIGGSSARALSSAAAVPPTRTPSPMPTRSGVQARKQSPHPERVAGTGSTAFLATPPTCSFSLPPLMHHSLAGDHSTMGKRKGGTQSPQSRGPDHGGQLFLGMPEGGSSIQSSQLPETKPYLLRRKAWCCSSFIKARFFKDLWKRATNLEKWEELAQRLLGLRTKKGIRYQQIAMHSVYQEIREAQALEAVLTSNNAASRAAFGNMGGNAQSIWGAETNGAVSGGGRGANVPKITNTNTNNDGRFDKGGKLSAKANGKKSRDEASRDTKPNINDDQKGQRGGGGEFFALLGI